MGPKGPAGGLRRPAPVFMRRVRGWGAEINWFGRCGKCFVSLRKTFGACDVAELFKDMSDAFISPNLFTWDLAVKSLMSGAVQHICVLCWHRL